MTTRCDLLVLGAGPAGMAHAFWRQRAEPGLGVRVIEKAPEPGGWVQTRRIEGYLCEIGPQGLRPNEVSDEFLSALGIEDSVVAADPAARHRYLARDGRLHPLPSGPGDLVKTDIFSLLGKLNLLLEPLRGRGDDAEESLAAFFGRRLGKQAIPLAEAMASGVYGGDAHAIEVAAAFPAVASLEQAHGSLFRGLVARRRAGRHAPAAPQRPMLCSFGGGMQTLVRALREQLGPSLTLGREVTGIRRRADDGHAGKGHWVVTLGGGVESTIEAKELTLAIPARCAAPLLKDVDSALAAELGGIPYASIANIYLGFRNTNAGEAPHGFGFLLDRREDSSMLGAIYCSSIFPQSAPPGKSLVRIMAGGTLRPDAVDRDEEDLASEAEQMLRKYTGWNAPLTFKRVYKAHQAIPQFVRGHSQRLRNIRQLTARHQGLRLIGNSYDEVSIVGQLRRP